MRFSIIVPVYNLEKDLPATMDSLLNQKDACEYEIILVDDGSTDGSPVLCDKYAEAYPGLVRSLHRVNGGPGAARNTGLANAKGEYIIFVDGDDSLKPDTVSKLATAVESGDADIIGFQIENQHGVKITSVDGLGVPIGSAFMLTDYKAYMLELPSLCNRAWKKSLFTENNIEFPENIILAEDLCVCTKLIAAAKSIFIMPDVFYCYNQHEGSILGDGGRSRNGEMITVFDNLIGWFKNCGLFDLYKDELSQLCTEHMLLAASVREIKRDTGSKLPAEFKKYTESNFPDYMQNHYMSRMSAPRRLALDLIRAHMYSAVKMLFRIKDGK